jgi:hypothetical protein
MVRKTRMLPSRRSWETPSHMPREKPRRERSRIYPFG